MGTPCESEGRDGIYALMFNSAVTDIPEAAEMSLNKLLSLRSELLLLGLLDGGARRKLHIANYTQ